MEVLNKTMKNKKDMMGYMQKRNSMQLSKGGDNPGTITVSSTKKQMPKEEANTRRAEFQEKFGFDRGSSQPLKKKSAPKQFKNREEMNKFFGK